MNDIIESTESTEDDKPDYCKCSKCGWSGDVAECATEMEQDGWENPPYVVHLCPKCEDGGCIDDYFPAPTIIERLEEKSLILQATGAIIASNLDSFESDAKEMLSLINTNLVTDEDFAIAKKHVDLCSLIEQRIKQAKLDALAKMESVNSEFTKADRINAEFANVRLILQNALKDRKVKRVAEIIAAGEKEIKDRIAISSAKHGVFVDFSRVALATKNCRSYASMESKVAAVVAEEITKIEALEKRYTENMLTIEKAEADYPGIFYDKNTIALGLPETVDLTIAMRIEKKKNDDRALADKKAAEVAEKELEQEVAETVSQNTVSWGKASTFNLNPTPIEDLPTITIAPTFVPPPAPVFDTPDPFLDTPIPPSIGLAADLERLARDMIWCAEKMLVSNRPAIRHHGEELRSAAKLACSWVNEIREIEKS